MRAKGGVIETSSNLNEYAGRTGMTVDLRSDIYSIGKSKTKKRREQG